jgi:hypothetical protein
MLSSSRGAACRPSRTQGRCAAHMGPARRAHRASFSRRWNRSTNPLAWGWYAVVCVSHAPHKIILNTYLERAVRPDVFPIVRYGRLPKIKLAIFWVLSKGQPSFQIMKIPLNNFLKIVFYSGMDASFPEILFILHSHDSCRRLWGKPGLIQGLQCDCLVSASGLNH